MKPFKAATSATATSTLLLSICMFVNYFNNKTFVEALSSSPSPSPSSSSSSSSSSTSVPNITIRVCEGSSCLSKCRGGFSPKSSFMERIVSSSPDNIVLEEAYCMNQCKRGPNMRIIRNDQVLTFHNRNPYPNTNVDNNNDKDNDRDNIGAVPVIMTETEIKRKTFQSVSSEERVEMIWGLIQDIHIRTVKDSDGDVDGDVDGDGDINIDGSNSNSNNVGIPIVTESGSVEKLTDLMPPPPTK